MDTDLLLDVSDYLTDLEVEHEIEMTLLTIDKTSVASKIKAKNPEESYNKLVNILNLHFQKRFHYTAKNDTTLVLDII